MIRKPPANWQPLDEGAAIRTVRTAGAIATGGVNVARRGGHAVRGVMCYFFAVLWGVAELAAAWPPEVCQWSSASERCRPSCSGPAAGPSRRPAETSG